MTTTTTTTTTASRPPRPGRRPKGGALPKRTFKPGDKASVLYRHERHGACVDPSAVVESVETRDGEVTSVTVRLQDGRLWTSLNHPDYIDRPPRT